MNPYMPLTAFVPDGEPRVFFHNGGERLFVYGSRDDRVTGYCGYGHDAWSAPVDNLTCWTHHGEIFNVRQIMDLGYGVMDDQHLGAPDCVYNPKTKKYYLYVFLGCGEPKTNNKVWVASSESPAGPFTDPKMCEWPHRGHGLAFDPAVLVDWDGKDINNLRVYAYWGFCKGNNFRAEIDSDDMRTVIEGTLHTPPPVPGSSNSYDEPGIPGFFEASSIRKVRDKYVFVYSGSPACILYYSYSDNPLGPWTPGGPIISNASSNMPGGNDHGGIIEVNGRWYINYHRPMPNNFNRMAAIEPVSVTVDENGQVIIPQVMMTSEGVEANGLFAFKRYSAAIVCAREGRFTISGHKRPADGMVEITDIASGSELGYLYFNFGDTPILNNAMTLKVNVKGLSDGVRIEVYMTDISETPQTFTGSKYKIGEIVVNKSDDFYDAFNTMDNTEGHPINLAGKRGIFLKVTHVSGGETCVIREIEFSV